MLRAGSSVKIVNLGKNHRVLAEPRRRPRVVSGSPEGRRRVTVSVLRASHLIAARPPSVPPRATHRRLAGALMRRVLSLAALSLVITTPTLDAQTRATVR